MKSFYNILSVILFPIVFVTLFFVIGGSEHGVTCWIGFAFTIFSYLLISLVPLLAPKTKSAHFFRMTSATLNAIYFGINFVIGLLFMIKDFDQWEYPLLVEIILFVLFFVYLLQVLRIDEVTAAKEIKHQKEVSAIKDLVNKTKMIIDITNDMQIKKNVQLVYNEINTCSTKSNKSVKKIDEAIEYSLDNLQSAVLLGDLSSVQNAAKSTIDLIKKRKNL